MNKKVSITIQVLVAIALGIWLSYYFNSPPPGEAPLQLGGDFTLTTADGPASLHDFKGKVTAIYFGYTSCPDVCPTALYNLAAAINKMTPEEQAQIQGLFVTLDPERDTPEKVGEYARHFHPGFIGMTGTQDQIDQVAQQYLVIHKKVPMPGSEQEYAIDHSSRVYIVGRDGKLLSMLPHSSTEEDTIAYLREALAK